jgi:hypothetical protein
MMHKKIYVHHYFSKTLFYKLAHNSVNKIFDINSNNIGSVKCNYRNLIFEFVFNPELNDNDDGVHLIDFFSVLFQKDFDLNYKNLHIVDSEDVPILTSINELLSNKKKWIITLFRTERILADYDKMADTYDYINPLQSLLLNLSNHTIVSDNLFLSDSIRFKYPHIHYAFTNTIWQWNELIGIRWYYEFKSIFEKLNFDYDLMYSVRNHKDHRFYILKGLSELNNDRILLQRTNSMPGSLGWGLFNDKLNDMPNVKLNSIFGEYDFDNLSSIKYQDGITYDLFFRLFSKAKVQVLDESWAWSNDEFKNQYLSEKTIGIILMNIPFISTHVYPIDFLSKILDLPPHPFHSDFQKHSGNSKLFVEFVEKFMKDFDSNYDLIKEWTTICHNKFLQKLNTNNDLLDMIVDEFREQKNIIKTNTKFI